MFRTSFVVGWIAVAAMFAELGCVDSSEADLEFRTSALGGSGTGCGFGFGGGSGTDTPGVRGFTRSDGVHMVVFRTANADDIKQASGTPLMAPLGIAGGALARAEPSGYKRHDGAYAILYIDIFQHVHEISVVDGNVDLINAFQLNAPNAAVAPPGGPAPDVIGYVRSDNKSAIVYRSVDDHVIELLSNFGGQPRWLVTDLTVASGAAVTITKGSAFPYVRADGWNTIVYIGSDNHIHELAQIGSSGWFDGDLHLASGETVAPSTEPWGYKRSDNWNTVVFIGTDSKLHELALLSSTWFTGMLPASPSPTGGLYGRPSGYVRADGVNAIVYTKGAEVHELKLLGGGWSDSVLPVEGCVRPIGRLFGHPAAGSRSSVLFQGRDASQTIRRYELSQPVGGAWSLQAF